MALVWLAVRGRGMGMGMGMGRGDGDWDRGEEIPFLTRP